MKKANESIDKSAPYRNLGSTMIKAPVKVENDPKSTVTKAKEDLRTKGGR